MNLIQKILLIFLSVNSVFGFFDIRDITSDVLTKLPKDFSIAVKDIAQALPSKSITIVRGNSTAIRSQDLLELLRMLSRHDVLTTNLNIATNENKQKYYKFLKKALDVSDQRTSLILCEPYECENILFELTENNLIHNMILYFFYWPYGPVSETFLMTIKEAMRVAVITNPRESVFRIYYNQGTPNRLNHLTLVNWWAGSLYKSPVLPPPDKVYDDFKGRVFEVPVLHAPPWHFVKYNNDNTITVTGGRDDKLLALLAKKLNFK